MKKDKTLLAAEGANKLIKKLKAKWQEDFPMGPKTIGMTRLEERKYWQNMEPEKKMKRMEAMGESAWDKLMEEIYGQPSQDNVL